MLDDIDRRLLRQVQADPEAPLAELAERARVPQSTAGRRLERLRSDGVLRGVRTEIGWAALGYAVGVSLRVTLDKSRPGAFEAFLAAAREVPEVTEIQTFLGRVDVRLHVVARDMAHYQEIWREKILALPHIGEIEALTHVATIKADPSLPI